MKLLNIISIILFTFVLNVKSDVDYTPEGCFGTTGCWQYCNTFGSCSSPFKAVTETGSNDGNICYCFRPYTEEELNKKNAGQCERYINQCLKLEISEHSCRLAYNRCDKNKWNELCKRANDIKHQRAMNVCWEITNEEKNKNRRKTRY